MRNLKRALSLTLASVMLLGMMVVGSSAAGYPDVTEEENIEAIEVLQTVGVMEGDNNGNFNPDDYVTREQMAVIMSKLLNLDYNYYQGTNPFSDVPAWAAPYVAACAANGITSGIGGGMYGAGQNVNAVQAALMMLKALGYFQYQEDFGDSYVLATVKQATEVGLFAQIDSNAQSALTRNEVAQMALNALKSDMVTFTGDVGTKIPTANGDILVGYKPEYTARTSTLAKYHAIEARTSDVVGGDNVNRGQYYIQLGEELYDGELKLRDAADDFERPSRTWEYQGKEIGTYMKKELIRGEYTTAINGKTLYELLGKAVIEENDVDYFWNGREDETIAATNMIRTNTKDYTTTGNGVLTQVFFDADDDQITIATIDTFLAKVEDDYNEKKGELGSVTIHTNRVDAKSIGFGTDTKIGVDEVPGIEKYKDGDRIMVQVAWSGRVYEIVTVADPEVIKDVSLNKYSKENYVVSDAQYDYALDGKNSNGAQDAVDEYAKDALTKYTYTLYLDKYGYLIGNTRTGDKDEYVFITGYDFSTSNLANSYATANGIFLDGTMKNIKVNVTDTQKNIQTHNNTAGAGAYGYQDFNLPTSNSGWQSEYNSWFKYTTETVDGVAIYTLKPVERWMDVAVTTGNTKINSASVRLDETVGPNDRAYGNDKSVYITVDTEIVSGNTNRGISKVNGRYTGVQDIDMRVIENTDTDNYKLTGTVKKLAEVDNNNKATGEGGVVTSELRVQVKEDETKVKSSIFAVYDADNYIIGAIVIGEDDGSNRDYIYVLDEIKNERVEGDDILWEVDVAKGGQVETMTIKTTKTKFDKIVDAFDDATDNVIPGNPDTAEAVNGMLKLIYDADGYVIDVERVGDTNTTDKVYGNSDASAQENIDRDNERAYLVQYDATKKGEWVNAVGSTVNPSGAAALGATYFNAKGRTLYSEDYGQDRGVTIVTGAPVVVIQPWIDSKGDIEYKYEVFTGENAVKNALKSMANEGHNFQGWIAAVLNERGTAEYLVLDSEIPYSVDTVDPDAGRGGESIEGAVEDTVGGATTAKFPGLPCGGYVFDDKPTDKAGDMNGDAEDNMFFLTKWDDSKAFNATLTIKDASGKVVYKEYTSAAAANPATGIKTPYFYVQLVGSGVNNKAKGYDLSDAPLKTGEYTWTITGLNIEEVNGSFTIR